MHTLSPVVSWRMVATLRIGIDHTTPLRDFLLRLVVDIGLRDSVRVAYKEELLYMAFLVPKIFRLLYCQRSQHYSSW